MSTFADTMSHRGWLTEGGLETDLIFLQGIDLPEFAAFPLLDRPGGVRALTEYFRRFASIAAAAGLGAMVETPTWRASSDWGALLGYDADELARVNRAAVALLRGVLDASAVPEGRVSGCIGPRGDGYAASALDADEAAAYHEPQIRALAEAGADLVHAMTMTAPAEATGVVRAARAVGIPVAVSFTVETDGRLPDGTPLADAFAALEAAEAADLYGLNCAHPIHVAEALDGGAWQQRLSIFRPNASTLSHAELDAAEELDPGDVDLLVRETRALRDKVPSLFVIGGCCGTDARHVGALADLIAPDRA